MKFICRKSNRTFCPTSQIGLGEWYLTDSNSLFGLFELRQSQLLFTPRVQYCDDYILIREKEFIKNPDQIVLDDA